MALKFIETKNKAKFTRRELLIGFSALLVLLMSFVFPQAAYGETFWLSLLFFAAFPAIIIGYFLKEPLENFGLSLGKPKVGVIFFVIIAALFILTEYFLLFYSKYGGQFSIARFIVNSFAVFIAFELFISLPLHFFWEFFFRGFIQLGLEKRLGIFSFFLAATLQTILSFRLSWIMISLIFFSSLGAGLIVRQSRSIFYSALALWLISAGLDIMIIRTVHQIAK